MRGRDAGVLNHIAIRNCFVHDVTGVVNWIGGDTADDDPPWVKFQTGWDASKRTGGIVVEVESANGTKTWFNDVVIENNVDPGHVVRRHRLQAAGRRLRLGRARVEDRQQVHARTPTSSCAATTCRRPTPQYGCNAFYITGVQHAVVERNVSKDAGTSAIEIYNSDDVKRAVQRDVRDRAEGGRRGLERHRRRPRDDRDDHPVQLRPRQRRRHPALPVRLRRFDRPLQRADQQQPPRHQPALRLLGDEPDLQQPDLHRGPRQREPDRDVGDGQRDAGGRLHDPEQHPALVARGVDGRHGRRRHLQQQPVLRRDRGRQRAAVRRSAVRRTARPTRTAERPGPRRRRSSRASRCERGSPAIDKGVSITGNGGVDFWGGTLYVRTADIGPYEAP